MSDSRIGSIVGGILMLCTAAGVTQAEGFRGREIPYDGLPAAEQGKFPIEMPTYDGVEQLLVLSSRWVIVATTNVEEVIAKVDELSGGELLEAVKTWRASEKAGRPNWTAYHARGKIRNRFIAKARELCGEGKLGEPAFFTVSSPDDPAYAEPRHPSRATRLLVSLGNERVPGGHNIHYAHYSYLEMPSPMLSGRQYAIRLGNGKRVTFRYDEMRTISRAIKVNQVGYLPDAGRKVAYLGAYLYEHGPMDCAFAKTFKVINVATGEVACEGPVALREKNPRFAPRPGKDDDPAQRPLMAGEDVYEIDLSGLKQTGEFFITIPGIGRSWTFRHARDVYGEAFYTACRGLFHQRCGIPLEPKHTPWTRIRCHTEPVYESQHIVFPPHVGAPKGYSVFDVIGSTTDTTRKTDHVVGGWHDAADWDRNLYHYSCVFDLLTVYEMFPAKFTDAQLHLPESGNGVPDILDEAEFGLRVWKHSMDARGGVSGMVETWTHPSIDNPDVKYSFSRRTRWSSLIFAAAAAQYARLVRPFDAKSADDYAAAAKKAHAFGADPANSLGRVEITARKKRGRGDPYVITWGEKGVYSRPYIIFAGVQLYRLTGDTSYLDGLADLARDAFPPFQWRFSYKGYSCWLYADIARAAADPLPDELTAHWKAFYLNAADGLQRHVETMPYRCTLPRHQNYWLGWGAADVTNHNRPLLLAYQLTGQAKYRDAAIVNADFMLGANPMGMSWTTGLGRVYPIDIQHANSETDGIMDPVPGITLYGITGGPIYYAFRQQVWQSPGADKPVSFIAPANRQVPLYRRWMCHPHVNVAQCEFTIHETMASTIFTAAALMPEGWKPDRRLIERNPTRDELLFGYWYLP